MVEIVCVDIFCKVSMMSSQLALPREGNLEELFHTFSFHRKYHNSEMVFDPIDPVVDKILSEEKDWTTSEFGSHTEE